MPHLLRAISGPQAGAVFVLEGRTTIGRASDCDIQIVHEGVSRHHAKVTRDAQGDMVLMDLSSDNGTFVEGERITRHVLTAGQAIRVMRTRFTYEVIDRADVATSAVFLRKVTSGDSLRQTAKHRPTLGAMRATGSPSPRQAGETGRPTSRPQAAAPAPSGARPGAVAVSSGIANPRTQASTKEFPLSEQVRPSGALPVYPSTPATTTEPDESERSGDYARDRWPDVDGASTEAQPAEATPQPGPPDHPSTTNQGVAGNSVSLGGASRGTGSYTSGVRDSEDEGSGAYGWHAGEGNRRRERITSVPTARPLPTAVPTTRPTKVPTTAHAEPSGRMAPSAPASASPPADPSDPPAAPTGTSRSGRPTPAFETPGAMRPGNTIGGSSEASLAPPRPSTPPPRRGSTAEYGLVLDDPPARDQQAAPPEVAPAPAAVEVVVEPSQAPTKIDVDDPDESSAAPTFGAEVTAEPADAASSTEDPESGEESDTMDAMDTLPTVRRAAPGEGASRATWHGARPVAGAPETLGSRTPTEEVPLMRGRGAGGRPNANPKARRGTSVRLSGDGAGPPSSSPRRGRTDAPVPVPVPVASVEGSVPSAAKPAGYEDTLRWRRPVPDAVPRPREHSPSDEIVAALERLVLNEGDPLPSQPQERPDARTLEGGPVEDLAVEDLLEAASTEVTGPQMESLSEIDKVELRAQQVLEQAERQRRHAQGLGILVDILEYRELRLRSLRGDALADPANARYTELEQRLQHLPDEDEAAAMRRYHRFVCSIPAQLTHQEGGVVNTVSVEVEDISAGGAKVTFGECSLGMGQTVWLAVDLEEAQLAGIERPDASTVVFQARVVWARDHDAELGLIFAGAPRYDESAIVHVDT